MPRVTSWHIEKTMTQPGGLSAETRDKNHPGDIRNGAVGRNAIRVPSPIGRPVWGEAYYVVRVNCKFSWMHHRFWTTSGEQRLSDDCDWGGNGWLTQGTTTSVGRWWQDFAPSFNLTKSEKTSIQEGFPITWPHNEPIPRSGLSSDSHNHGTCTRFHAHQQRSIFIHRDSKLNPKPHRKNRQFGNI